MVSLGYLCIFQLSRSVLISVICVDSLWLLSFHPSVSIHQVYLLYYLNVLRYRAPECLLTDGYYNHKMDLWGVGCVFFEVMR